MQQARNQVRKGFPTVVRGKQPVGGTQVTNGAVANGVHTFCMQSRRAFSSDNIKSEIYTNVCRNIYNSSIAIESPSYEHVSAGDGESIFDVTSGDGAGGNGSSANGTQVHFVRPADIVEGVESSKNSSFPTALVEFLRDQKDCILFSADKVGTTITLYNPLGDKNNYILIALGKGEKVVRYSEFEKAMNTLGEEIEKRKLKQVLVYTYPDKEVNFFSSPRDLAKTLKTASYRFDLLKEKKKDGDNDSKSGDGNGDSKSGSNHDGDGESSDDSKKRNTSVSIITKGGSSSSDDAVAAVKEGLGIAMGQNYARTLKNLPANICSTDYMRKEMESLQQYDGFSDYVCLSEKEMTSLGMGCFTAVGVGSSMPSYLCKIEYNKQLKDANPDQVPTVVLLGKGVVHDSGGLCIKPGSAMPAMKMDMGGSASVLGTLKALQALNLPIHVVGTIGLVENSISSKAYRPGDVLKSMNGITVEVGNTDAEGRLVLCDALTWIEKTYGTPETKPIVIDMATLTGACVIALGGDLTGGYSNDPALLEALEMAGKAGNDRLWKMPLLEVENEYLEQMKSDSADINNIGGPAAGSITAALFLSKFAKKLKWAHLDIAGTAMGGSFDKPKATGRPVPLLVEYLKSVSAKV